MAERWRYAERPHPPYCTCVNCRGDGPRAPHSQPSNQLRAILEKWRANNFDPHFILGVTPDSSSKLILEAHRRWIIAYHPDKHNNDPLANELTKHLNAARDELLGKGTRRSRTHRERQRRDQEAEKRARESERRKRDEERRQRANAAERQRQERERRTSARETERQRMQEEARRQGVREAERLMRDAARGRKHRQPMVKNTNNKRRASSIIWPVLAIALAGIIVIHLVLTVETPETVDNIMHNWARLFDQALARQ